MPPSALNKIFMKSMLASALSSLMLYIGNVVDSIVIGRFLGVNALTAYGLTHSMVLFFIAQLGIFMAGMQSCGGNAIGTGNMRLADEYFSSALCFELGL